MFKRYSRQREVVYQVLSATYAHPTADWVFDEAKKILPQISIATVYRNLRELVKNGMARVVLTEDDREHFDANTSEHPHFICRRCGRVIDVNTVGSEEIADGGFKVERRDTTFFGICTDCAKIEED